jgi:hypothetical protein
MTTLMSYSPKICPSIRAAHIGSFYYWFFSTRGQVNPDDDSNEQFAGFVY